MGQGLEDREKALRRQGAGLPQHREQGLPGARVAAAGPVQGVGEATLHGCPHGLRDQVVSPAPCGGVQGRATDDCGGIAKAAGSLFGIGRGDCPQRSGTHAVVGVVEQRGEAVCRVAPRGKRPRRGRANGRFAVFQGDDGNLRQVGREGHRCGAPGNRLVGSGAQRRRRRRRRLRQRIVERATVARGRQSERSQSQVLAEVVGTVDRDPPGSNPPPALGRRRAAVRRGRRSLRPVRRDRAPADRFQCRAGIRRLGRSGARSPVVGGRRRRGGGRLGVGCRGALLRRVLRRRRLRRESAAHRFHQHLARTIPNIVRRVFGQVRQGRKRREPHLPGAIQCRAAERADALLGPDPAQGPQGGDPHLRRALAVVGRLVERIQGSRAGKRRQHGRADRGQRDAGGAQPRFHVGDEIGLVFARRLAPARFQRGRAHALVRVAERGAPDIGARRHCAGERGAANAGVPVLQGEGGECLVVFVEAVDGEASHARTGVSNQGLAQRRQRLAPGACQRIERALADPRIAVLEEPAQRRNAALGHPRERCEHDMVEILTHLVVPGVDQIVDRLLSANGAERFHRGHLNVEPVVPSAARLLPRDLRLAPA